MKEVKECQNCNYRNTDECCTNPNWTEGAFKDYLVLLQDLIGHIATVKVSDHFSCPQHETKP